MSYVDYSIVFAQFLCMSHTQTGTTPNQSGITCKEIVIYLKIHNKAGQFPTISYLILVDRLSRYKMMCTCREAETN